MKKVIIVLAVLALGGAIWLGVRLLTDSGLDVERYAFERERSRPADCFPELGGGSEASTAESAEPSNPPPFDLTGTWAQRQVTTAIAHAPIVGETITTSTNLLRMELVQDGHQVTMTAEVCAIRQETTSDAGRTIVPQSFIDAIGSSRRSVTLEPVESGYRFRQERYVRNLGMTLEDPLNDPIPQNDEDPRVVDSDADGHPGITVLVEGIVDGEAYIVQRHWKELCGDVLSQDRVDGYINWDTHQKVIGASSFVLNRTPSSAPHPDWELNRFTLRRVEPTTTCADIIADEAPIFAEPPTESATSAP